MVASSRLAAYLSTVEPVARQAWRFAKHDALDTRGVTGGGVDVIRKV